MKSLIDPSVSSAALRRFWDALLDGGTELHCLNIRKDEQPLVRWSAAPYECTDKRELYSLSKSFCSTTAGVAFDQGLLDPEAAVLKFFPEYADQCAADERWQHMKVKHVASMNTGHAECVFPGMAFGDDSVQAFFDVPLAYEPGSHFVYNTGATCLLAEIVRRATGMTAPQILARYVFPALGIDDFEWRQCTDGHCQGGTGLRLCCDDLAKLGQLYLNKGVWNGQRVISEEWVRMATSVHSDNSVSDNPNPDWRAGYGFQFWKNEKLGYRGDGAYGQLCVILPEKRMVIAMQAESSDMQAELNAIWALLEELEGPEQAELPEGYIPKGSTALALDTGWRTLAPNAACLCGARLRVDDQGAKLWLTDDSHMECLTAPSGRWQESTLRFAHMLPALFRENTGPKWLTMRVSAAARTEGDAVILECRSRNTPHAFDWKIAFDEQGKMHMELDSRMNVFGEIKNLDEA